MLMPSKQNLPTPKQRASTHHAPRTLSDFRLTKTTCVQSTIVCAADPCMFVADIRHLLAELVFGATVSSESVREQAPSDGHKEEVLSGSLDRFVPPMLLP